MSHLQTPISYVHVALVHREERQLGQDGVSSHVDGSKVDDGADEEEDIQMMMMKSRQDGRQYKSALNQLSLNLSLVYP